MDRLCVAALICALVTLSSCVGQPRKPGQPAWPQAVIAADKSELRELFLATLAAEGAAIDESGESVLQVRIPDPNATMARLFFGCPSCADPYIKTTLVFSTVPSGTQVVVQYWRVVPTASGNESRMDMRAPADYQQWQQILDSVRDRYAQPRAVGAAGQ